MPRNEVDAKFERQNDRYLRVPTLLWENGLALTLRGAFAFLVPTLLRAERLFLPLCGLL